MPVLFLVHVSGGKFMNVVTELFLVHTKQGKCMIFVAEFFLVPPMKGTCFCAALRIQRKVHEF